MTNCCSENNTSEEHLFNAAIGHNNSVKGNDSIALGSNLKTWEGQVVLGANNALDTKAAFIIADGGASVRD
jgi:hypothetical protein